MSKFVKVQQDVLDSLSKNQLVSAGAGSGKTTIMIEKIGNLLINEKIDPQSLLVVTFTVLAAGEMKERLINRLKKELETAENKEEILSLIEKIKIASIDTIDGFSSKTIKKYFYELKLSPNLEIISDTTRDYYLNLVLNQTFEEFAKDHMEIDLLLDYFGGNKRNLESLKSLVLSNYYNIINLENYEKFLENAKNEYKNSEKSEKIIKKYIFSRVKDVRKCIIENSFDPSHQVSDKLAINVQLLNKFDENLSLKDNLKVLKSIELIKFTTKECNDDENLKIVNKGIKSFVDLQNELLENGIDENFPEKNQKILEFLPFFIELIENFIKNYNEIKNKNNLIDFNDLNRYMLKLLKNEKVKKELQNRFKYIFIDEYQDVNPLQDKLLSSLGGENSKVFMVGDVKQSIYGFRGASPEWFINKYENYKSNPLVGSAFDMNVNFRSNPKVLLFINDIFKILMTRETSDIDYEKTSKIEPKREDIVDDKVEILLINSDQKELTAKGVYSVKNDCVTESLNASQKEAMLVVDKITKLIGTEFYDANRKIVRPLTYKDFAILARAEKDEATTYLANLLRSVNIPINVNNKLDANQSEVIKLVMSILKCVAGIADDVDYLASFLSLTNLDVDDLIEIIKPKQSFKESLKQSEKQEVKKGFEILKQIEIAGCNKNNSQLIRYILNEQKLKLHILGYENGEKELNLLYKFLDKLSVENNLNLVEFIKVVETDSTSASDFNESDSENSVTIETIHKSKGLEYPVVILFNCSKMFTYIRDNDNINFNADIGFGVDYFDSQNRTKYYSVPKFAITLLNREKGYKEELRLLYVALTRAKNKLIITGQYNPKMLTEGVKKTNYANMILSCFLDRLDVGENEFENCRINLLEEENFVLENAEKEKRNIIKNPEFVYQNANSMNLPFNYSVTNLNKENYEKLSEIETLDLEESAENKQFDKNKALIGTHYHKALEELDFMAPYQKTTNFKDVNYSKIEMAHKVISSIAKNSINIYKEAEFSMLVPHKEIFGGEIEDKILIDGICDLLIEFENSFVVVDYKFSSLKSKKLKEKYMEQLRLYKIAVEKAYEKKVEHMYIYSINAGELI